MLEGLAAGGVVGVVKHMPGHGRAVVDSHHLLPTVSASAEALEADLEPFRTLRHAPMGMTSHIVFEAWDAERPATLSPTIVNDVIRGMIGFDGLLMTDDIDMKALSGTAGEKAAGAIARDATSSSTAGRGWTRWSRSPGGWGRSATRHARGWTRQWRASARPRAISRS